MKNVTGRTPAALALAFAAPALGALFALTPMVASAQVVYLAPPAPVYEMAPAPRVGYLWQPGYWGWLRGGYVWVPGHWAMAGAPVPPPRAEAGQVMRLSADALFAFDRGDVGDLLPGGRADIREIAARLRAMRYARIEVRGYTDRLGSASYNLDLSRRRANAVKTLLIEDGVDAGRIDAVGLGEQDPISRCDAGLARAALVECLQPDRRVEIVTYARGSTG